MSAYPITAAAFRIAHEQGHPPPSAGAVMMAAAAENAMRDALDRITEGLRANAWVQIHYEEVLR